MARTAVLVEILKRELRSRGITYAAVAGHLGMSETSVKRMFARKEFTLSRLDRICELAAMEFSELARLLAVPGGVISRLTYEQEKEFVENHRLMLVALCALNHWSFHDIVAAYNVAPAECVKLLARLDKLKFIELLPNKRLHLDSGRTDPAAVQGTVPGGLLPLELRPGQPAAAARERHAVQGFHLGAARPPAQDRGGVFRHARR